MRNLVAGSLYSMVYGSNAIVVRERSLLLMSCEQSANTRKVGHEGVNRTAILDTFCHCLSDISFHISLDTEGRHYIVGSQNGTLVLHGLSVENSEHRMKSPAESLLSRKESTIFQSQISRIAIETFQSGMLR
jgi:hypothetical protein